MPYGPKNLGQSSALSELAAKRKIEKIKCVAKRSAIMSEAKAILPMLTCLSLADLAVCLGIAWISINRDYEMAIELYDASQTKRPIGGTVRAKLEVMRRRFRSDEHCLPGRVRKISNPVLNANIRPSVSTIGFSIAWWLENRTANLVGAVELGPAGKVIDEKNTLPSCQPSSLLRSASVWMMVNQGNWGLFRGV